MNPRVIRLLLAVAGTAGLTFFLDPTTGQRRRAVTRDVVSRFTTRVTKRTRAVSRDISDRTQRLANEAMSRWRDEIETDDAVCRRVRAAVRETVPRHGAIGVAVTNGHVVIHGEVLTHEHEPLLRAVRAVPGVNELTDHLIERASLRSNGRSENGATEASGWKRYIDLRQERWTPTTRLATGLVGSALIRNAARHPSLLGVLAGVAGSTLVARSAVNKPLTRIGRRHGVIDVHRSLVIQAPVERVFALVDSVENFPCFMRSVREVRREEDGRSHWVVRGPAGSTLEWDSITTVRRPNEMLAWHSVPGSKPEHSGVIHFQRLDDNQTRLDLRMSYSPPVGTMGHAVARLLGADSELDAHLAQVKRVAEAWDSWRSSVETGRSAAEAQRANRVRRSAPASSEMTPSQ